MATAVSLHMVSGKVSFRDRLCDDGCLHRMNDDTSPSEARAQCPANWTRLLRITDDILGRYPYIVSMVGCFSKKDLVLFREDECNTQFS